MRARRPIRRNSRHSKRSCRTNCSGARTKRARSWSSSRAVRRPRRPIRPVAARRSNGGYPGARVRAPDSDRFNLKKSRPGGADWMLVGRGGLPGPVTAVAVLHEHFGDLWVPHWLAAIVRQQVLFGHVGDVFGFVVLSEEVIERLIFIRPHFGGDRLIPFFRVVEDRIDIEHHAAEREQPMPHHLADLIFRAANLVHGSGHSRPILPATGIFPAALGNDAMT